MDKDMNNPFSNFVTFLVFVVMCFLIINLCRILLNSIIIVKTTSTQQTIQLTEPIRQDGLSYVTISKNVSEARYINNNGEEIAIPLSDDCRIFHKNGNQNKISYKISKEYNIFNEKVDEYATRVTIYKASTQ